MSIKLVVVAVVVMALLATLVACSGLLRPAAKVSQMQPLQQNPVIAEATQRTGTFEISPELKPYIDNFSKTDFSAEMAGRNSSWDDQVEPQLFNAEEDHVNPSTLSPGERKLLFGVSNGTGAFTLANIQLLCYRFQNDTGRMPQNAGELSAWLWKNQTEFADQISRKPHDQQFIDLIWMINPVTGKFYDSFEANTWTPGGVMFRELKTEDEVIAAYAGRAGLSREQMHYPSFKGAWTIEVWGEKPGVKLGIHPGYIVDPDKLAQDPPEPDFVRAVRTQGDAVAKSGLNPEEYYKAHPDGDCGCSK
jgi:hypothetical protein